MTLILASASPRRAELLQQIGLAFRTTPSDLEEGEPRQPVEKWVQELACSKALKVVAQRGEIVLAADTVVVLDELVLGKPESPEQAANMLEQLSGRMHEVITGICVVDRPRAAAKERVHIYQDYALTKVYFRKLTSTEIKAYVASGEPMDKAGAYGIQGLGSLLVEKIEGCYYNVMGLPLTKTMHLLRKCGVRIMGEI